MKTELYFIRDRISGAVTSNPVSAVNVGIALNGFNTFCQAEKAKKINPAMYELVCVGSFEDSGELKPLEVLDVVANGENVLDALKRWSDAHFEAGFYDDSEEESE